MIGRLVPAGLPASARFAAWRSGPSGPRWRRLFPLPRAPCHWSSTLPPNPPSTPSRNALGRSRRHFAGEPLSREAGELLWKELLMHGGARDPHGMLEALLGEIGSGSEAGVRAGVESLLEDMGIEPGPSR